MGQVIELCRTCGFDIPADTDACPACEPTPPPTLAARQVAGLALPTRSVHPLTTVAARRERAARPLGRARAARTAFSFTTTLALLTFAAAGIAWLVQRPRFVLQVPGATVDLLNDVTFYLAVASVVAFLIGFGAMAVWCVRAVARGLHGLVARPPYA